METKMLTLHVSTQVDAGDFAGLQGLLYLAISVCFWKQLFLIHSFISFGPTLIGCQPVKHIERAAEESKINSSPENLEGGGG